MENPDTEVTEGAMERLADAGILAAFSKVVSVDRESDETNRHEPAVRSKVRSRRRNFYSVCGNKRVKYKIMKKLILYGEFSELIK